MVLASGSGYWHVESLTDQSDRDKTNCIKPNFLSTQYQAPAACTFACNTSHTRTLYHQTPSFFQRSVSTQSRIKELQIIRAFDAETTHQWSRRRLPHQRISPVPRHSTVYIPHDRTTRHHIRLDTPALINRATPAACETTKSRDQHTYFDDVH